jgi:hypothetical protein
LSCKWKLEPNKILTPAALQIFFNIDNTYKLINESYQKDWEFDDLFSKSKDQIWKIRETIMLYNFKKYQSPQIDTNVITNLRLNDADFIEDHVSISEGITILQYIKDSYYKNGNIHLAINKCIKGPILSWIDYQRNFVETIEILEQGITEEEEEQMYWTNRLSIGLISEDTLKEIIKKALVKIKFNYILDHPELLPKFLPLISVTISPISIALEYSPVINKTRTKWKSADQLTYNFKFK